MLVYNIRKAKYADSLKASGVANRWNKDDEFVIYAGGSISLSTLELVAHRSAIDLNLDYKLLFIETDSKSADITEINVKDLPKNWKSIQSYPILQELGSKWYQAKKTLLLKVPSALIPWESNYLINVSHPDFAKKVKIKSAEDFLWDKRLF
jgi:RES domain-containing protein